MALVDYEGLILRIGFTRTVQSISLFSVPRTCTTMLFELAAICQLDVVIFAEVVVAKTSEGVPSVSVPAFFEYVTILVPVQKPAEDVVSSPTTSTSKTPASFVATAYVPTV